MTLVIPGNTVCAMPEQLATEYLNMRVTPDFKESVAKVAEAERRELSIMAKMLIEEALEARAARAKKAAKKQ